MTDARTIPPCPVCNQSTCADPADCRTQMLTRRPDDARQVRGLTDDLSGFVLSPAEWRAKYGEAA